MSDSPPALPSFTNWPTFPFEGDLHVKKLDDPVAVEPTRHGEDPADCRACQAPDEAYIWVSDRWRVRSLDRPTGLPVVAILESRSHLDMGDLSNMLAAELGVMTVRLERAVRSLDGVARVHVNRWGDGAAHLHVWFMARPLGRLQLRGTFLSLWDEILPPIPEFQWRENLALLAAWLEEFGGRAIAEPPHLDWKAPAQLANVPQADEDDAGESSDAEPSGQHAELADDPTEPVSIDVPDAPDVDPNVEDDGSDQLSSPTIAIQLDHVPDDGDPADGVSDDAVDVADLNTRPAGAGTPTRRRDGVAKVAVPTQSRANNVRSDNAITDDHQPVPVPVRAGAPDDTRGSADALPNDDGVAPDGPGTAGRPGSSRKRRLRRR